MHIYYFLCSKSKHTFFFTHSHIHTQTLFTNLEWSNRRQQNCKPDLFCPRVLTGTPVILLKISLLYAIFLCASDLNVGSLKGNSHDTNSRSKYDVTKRNFVHIHYAWYHTWITSSRGHSNTVSTINFHSNIYSTRCNVTWFIYIWKPLCMFRVVPPPIVRSTYNCIYSIWYLSHSYCYLPLSAAGSSNSVTNNICCRYSCMRSWWWVAVPPETCRAVSR